jgi:hypothetical protein
MVGSLIAAWSSVACSAPEGDDDTSDIGADSLELSAKYQSIRKKKREFADALSFVERDQERLARQLSVFGALLSGEEQRQYTKGFAERKQVIAHAESMNTATHALADAIAAVTGDQKAMRELSLVFNGENDATGDPTARDQANLIYDSCILLAKSHRAKTALDFANEVISDNPLFGSFKAPRYTNIRSEIILPAAPVTILTSLASGKTQAAALEELAKYGGDLAKAAESVRSWLRTDRVPAKKSGDILPGTSRAIYAVLVFDDAAKEGEKAKVNPVLKALLLNSPDLVEGTHYAISSYRVLLQSKPALPELSPLIGRFGGLVTVIAGIYEAGQVSAAQLEHSSGKLNVASALASAASGVLVFFSGGAAIAVAGIGFVLGWLASVKEQQEFDAEDKADRAAILPSLGLDSSTRLLVNEANSNVSGLGLLGYTSTEVRQVGKLAPMFLRQLTTLTPEVRGLKSYRKMFRTNAAREIDMMEAVVAAATFTKEETAAEFILRFFSTNARFVSRDLFLSSIEADASGRSASSPERKALTALRSYSEKL